MHTTNITVGLNITLLKEEYGENESTSSQKTDSEEDDKFIMSDDEASSDFEVRSYIFLLYLHKLNVLCQLSSYITM